MNPYLDDDSADRQLAAMLRNAGHSVTIPVEVQLLGAMDTRHFIHAIRERLVLITRNHDDFVELHEVVQAAQGRHPGMFIIRSDNDPRRDMSLRQIVTAISNIERSGVPIPSQVYILNHWR